MRPGASVVAHTAAVTLCAVALTCGACGSSRGGALSHGSTTESAVTSLKSLSDQYLAFIAPVNDAVRTLQPKNETGATLVRDVAPLARALDTFDHKAGLVRWPTPVAVDIRAEEKANEVVIGDLNNAANVDGLTLTYQGWASQLVADAGRLNSSVSTVRADLGLSPMAGP